MEKLELETEIQHLAMLELAMKDKTSKIQVIRLLVIALEQIEKLEGLINANYATRDEMEHNQNNTIPESKLPFNKNGDKNEVY